METWFLPNGWRVYFISDRPDVVVGSGALLGSFFHSFQPRFTLLLGLCFKLFQLLRGPRGGLPGFEMPPSRFDFVLRHAAKAFFINHSAAAETIRLSSFIVLGGLAGCACYCPTRTHIRQRRRNEKSRGLPGRMESRPFAVRIYSSSRRFCTLSAASQFFLR